MADPLSGMGLAGWVIGGGATAIVVLAGAIAVMWKSGNDSNKSRIAELNENGEALQKLLVDTNKAMGEMVETAKKRNEVTEKLMELMTQQGGAFAIFAEQYRLHQATTGRDLDSALDAVKSMSDSIRVIDRTISDVARVVLENSRQAHSVIGTAADTNQKITQLLQRSMQHDV